MLRVINIKAFESIQESAKICNSTRLIDTSSISKNSIVFPTETEIKRTISLTSLKQEALKDKSDNSRARPICWK